MLVYSIYIVFQPAYMKQIRPSGRSRNLPLFMQMEGSFLCAQEPTTGSCTVAGKFTSALQDFFAHLLPFLRVSVLFSV
jgi:hypothetical protein